MWIIQNYFVNEHNFTSVFLFAFLWKLMLLCFTTTTRTLLFSMTKWNGKRNKKIMAREISTHTWKACLLYSVSMSFLLSKLHTSQCSLYRVWKALRCSKRIPSGRVRSWRSISTKSGNCFDASAHDNAQETGTTESWFSIIWNKIISIHFLNCLFNKLKKKQWWTMCRCSSPRNCWYCCTWAEMSQSVEPCCWPIPPTVPLVIPCDFWTGFTLFVTSFTQKQSQS